MDKSTVLDDFIDIHICGACKAQFHNVDNFLLHKRQCPQLAELRARLAAKMVSESSAESQTSTSETDQRTSEGERSTIRHLVEAAENELTTQQQIGQSETDSPGTELGTVPSSGQPVVMTKEAILQPQVSDGQAWGQQMEQTPSGSPGVIYLSSDEQVIFQRSKEETLLQKDKESRNREDLDDVKQLPPQTIYVEAIQQPPSEQSYDLNRVKSKEEQFSGMNIDRSESPGQRERTDVIVTEGVLTTTSAGGIVIESNTLLANAEIVQQGEQFLANSEAADGSGDVQAVMYDEEHASGPRQVKGHELMMAIDDPISPSRKKYKCTFGSCTFITLYIRDLERHVRTHTGEKPFQCPHCSKAFSRSDKLKIHLRGHTGSKPFRCNICDYGAADSSSLRKHLRIHTDERPFKCQICPYASRNSSQLIVHLRTHTGDTPFQCSLCEAKFKINSDLKRHMRTHTGEKPYGCELCEYRCSIRGNLKSHLRINHSNENEVKCNYCDYQTSSRKALREHKKIHDTTHPVKCPTCSYCCASNSALKAHLRIHCEDRPFNCTFCTYCSKQSGNVKTHIRKKHPDKMLGERKPGRTIVKKGARAVATNTPSPSKSREERSYGSNLKPNCKKTFRCNICTAAFVREDSLRSHMRQHCKEIAQNLESTALAVLQLQNSGPNDSRTSESVVSTMVTIAQSGADTIEQEMDGVMVASPNGSVSSVNVLQSPVMSHTVDPTDQQRHARMKRPINRGGLQDIAEAAATLSQIPHRCPSPVRPASPYQHPHYVPPPRTHSTAASLGFHEESMGLSQLPPNSQHQAMPHQQYVQSNHNMQSLQNMYPQLKLVNSKPYLSSEAVPHGLPHHQPLPHLNPQHPTRVLSQPSDSGTINLQVVQPPEPYPVSLVTRDLQLHQQQQQQQQQHQQQQQQQQHPHPHLQPQQQHQQHHQQLHQQPPQQPLPHLHPSQVQHPSHLHPHQQQQHHTATSSASQQPQIQIILPSSGFTSSHPGNQQVSQSLPNQPQSSSGRIVVQFQEPNVSTAPPEPNVITLSSSVCQALISQIRMQDSIAGQAPVYQPDTTSVPPQEVVVAVDTQESSTTHPGYPPNITRPQSHS